MTAQSPDDEGAGAGTDAAPALLVPMTVEALTLVQGSADLEWSWAPPNYRRLSSYQSVDAQPFDPTAPKLGGTSFTGAVLHWALPDGITHGTQAGAGAPVTYPAAPNRWLVMRTAPDPTDPGRWQSAGWVVASDVVGDPAGSPFPDAAGDGATSLGRSWPLADWPGESGLTGTTLEQPVTAVGSGDATFAAYVPNVASVFGFADPLAGLTRGPVSYAVLGWYSDPQHDPLLGVVDLGPDGWQTLDEWTDLMSRYGWSVGDDADLERSVAAASAWAVAHGQTVDPARPRTTHPARTLCHGTISDIFWAGESGPVISAVPTSNPEAAGFVRPTVAIGHNAIDALAATIAVSEADRLDPSTLAQLVEIVQAVAHDELGLLDAPDAQAQLDLVVQQAWFGSTPGGTRWSVVSTPDVDAPRGRSSPPLDAAARAALAALHCRQSDLDRCARSLASDQNRFASAWWKVARLDHWPPPPPADEPPDDEQAAARAELDDSRADALASVGGYRFARQARDAAFVALRRALDEQTGILLDVRAEAMDPFSAPADPVLLVTGAHRSFTHGEDDRYTDDGTSSCRFTGQTVDGIEVQVTQTDPTFVLVDTASVTVPVFTGADLPPEVPDLVAERFFLDTAAAPAIARAARPSDPWPLLGQIRTDQTVVWNAAAHHPQLDVEALADLSGLHFAEGLGAVPSPVGVSLWRPPWTPLFLAWSVTYLPGRMPATQALDPWAPPLDAAVAGTDDFTWTWRSGESPGDGPAVALQGRTLLTPQATHLLAERISTTIESLGQTPDVQADLWALLLALDQLTRADVLSQALSGFGDALLQRQSGSFRMPVDATLAPELDPVGAPSLRPSAVPLTDATNDAFSPIRGGHLAVEQLWVVDAFGQVFDVLAAMHVVPADLDLVTAPDLHTAGSSVLAELKPRLAQPSRLRLDWLDAASDAALQSTADGDPVCGWFVLNHLDRSLLVYDPDGCPLGELVAAQDGARWIPSPETTPPPHGGAPPVAIQDRHVRAVVTELTSRADGRAALLELLDLIDRATWAIDPSGGWDDEMLPVLVGRPLALVRAGLRLELAAGPATRQTWADSGRHDTDGFETVAFPVQLGSTELLDDGLVGYYLDDDPTVVNSVYAAADVSAGAPPDYVGTNRPCVRADGSIGALLTLLLDPWSSVHAISGIGPVPSVFLPPGVAQDALARLAVTFRAGPVLGSGPAVAAPLPALRDGSWSWLEYSDATQPATTLSIAPVDASAPLLDALPQVREGWLRLQLGGIPTRFAYSVAPAVVTCTSDPRKPSSASLQVSVYNPTADAVPFSAVRITVSVGGAPADLVSTSVTTAARVLAPDDATWQADVVGAQVVLRPIAEGAALAGGQTVVVLVAGLVVNPVAGQALLWLDEVTDTTRQSSLTVTKTTAPPPVPTPTEPPLDLPLD